MDVPLVLIPCFQLFVFISITVGNSDTGLPCKHKCGVGGPPKKNGRFRCYIKGCTDHITGTPCTDYCTPQYNGKILYLHI